MNRPQVVVIPVPVITPTPSKKNKPGCKAKVKPKLVSKKCAPNVPIPKY